MPRKPSKSDSTHREGRELSSRDVALGVLVRVEEGGAFAAPALDAELERSKLVGRDRGLTTDLVYGVLRWQGALDQRLAGASRRPIPSLDPFVRAGLRLGAYQLLGPSRVPSHAAVAESVAAVRRRRGKTFAGFVNAVLRALGRGETAPLEPSEALPKWLKDTLGARLGDEGLSAFAQSTVEQPWTGLRAELHRTTRQALLERLGQEAGEATLAVGTLSPRAILARGLGPAHRLPSFEEGLVTVQDEGAQAAALLLDVSGQHRVLDACAGRGGKTGLLASLAGEGAEVHAADRHPRKLARLAEEIARLGLPPVRTAAVDLEVGVAGLEPPYDRILVDAPCTGTGTLARRPEIRWRLLPEDVERLVAVQRRILERCAGLLAPGGALVYAVCSVLPEEGAEQVQGFLAGRGGEGLSLAEDLALWPHRHGTDGFFAARLVSDRP